MGDDRQTILDRFYKKRGPCCAGCDHWQHYNSMAGECTRSAPVSGRERMAMLGIEMISMPIGAGHPFTPRNHVCGEFRDTFDWASLPLPYRKAVGDSTVVT